MIKLLLILWQILIEVIQHLVKNLLKYLIAFGLRYKEFYTLFENKEAEFGNFVFEELSMEFIRDLFEEDPVKQFGKYWDEKTEIDLVAKTTSGKIIAGNCKYINSKIKKNELNKLKEDCKTTDLNVDTFVLFSKSGFSSELKSQKSETLKLFTPKSFKLLLA